MIQEVNVHDHRVQLGETSSEHRQFTSKIADKIIEVLNSTVDMRKIDVYNLNREFCNYSAGNKDRIVIYGNASRKGVSSVINSCPAPFLDALP